MNVNLNLASERKKRVKIIKRVMLGFNIVVIMFLIFYCIYLMKKVDNLENQLQSIEVMKQQNKNLNNDIETNDNPVLPSVQTVDSNQEKDNVNTDQKEIKKKDEKKVYLTFDDGPSTLTSEVLDILKQEDVKATFFVLGKEDKNSKQLYRRIVEEGHTLAMHSYTHIYDNIYKSMSNYKEDITKLSDLLYDVTGIRPKYYRFPGGSSNTRSDISIKKCISYLNKKKITYFDWNVVNGDANGKEMTVKKMVNSVMDDVNKYNTSIVLMHDGPDKQKTVKALPKIIKKLKKEDYSVLPIDDDTYPIQHLK